MSLRQLLHPLEVYMLLLWLFQVPRPSSWRARNVLCTWNIPRRERSLHLAVESAATLTHSNSITTLSRHDSAVIFYLFLLYFSQNKCKKYLFCQIVLNYKSAILLSHDTIFDHYLCVLYWICVDFLCLSFFTDVDRFHQIWYIIKS